MRKDEYFYRYLHRKHQDYLEIMGFIAVTMGFVGLVSLYAFIWRLDYWFLKMFFTILISYIPLFAIDFVAKTVMYKNYKEKERLS